MLALRLLVNGKPWFARDLGTVSVVCTISAFEGTDSASALEQNSGQVVVRLGGLTHGPARE